MRHALLTYEQNPQKTIEFLRSRLGLNFNHQREVLGQAPNLPTALDPALIARQNLLQRAYQRSGNLDPVEDSALEWLTAAELTPERRRHLLQRLTRPDFANLPKLVADDLNHPNSPGFGAFGIHRQMLRSQLDELLKLKPELLNQGNFVTAYLAKLQPAADDDWRRDPALMEKYLDSLKAFVDRLAPVHNSLKAHIAYHRLVLDRNRGKLDKQRFLDYLKLPRPLPYVAPALLQADGNRQFHVDVNADYRGATLLAPVGNDEPVVRAYLQALLLDATNTEEFTPYIHDVYLKHLFAEVKIVNGLGEPEQWASQLPPELFQQLKARVDLDFAPTNSSNFATDEPVRLDLFVKNVSTLIVKVFEINTPNYYRQQLREIDTDVNLDGLVANVEQTHNYAEAPLRRVQRRFEFPQLSKSGVYIIDFIGNGRSSRALIRKGKLRYVATTGTAGHVVRVYDEKNQPAPDATVWLGGRDYAAEKDGAVRIPFSTSPGRVPIVLTRGEFACFDSFQHDGESYTLNAGFYVDREALLTRKKAELLIRPSLLLNGQPVSLNLLEEARLQVQSSDQDGVATTQDLGGVKPLEDRELVHTFQVPARLAGLSFQLRGKVRSLTLDRKIDVAVGDQFVLNQIDRTDKIEDIHLAQFAGAWVLELRGKTGEPKPARPLQIRLKHRDFKELIVTVLKTDERGRVLLGNLPGIVSISAQGPEGTQHAWPLRQDRHTYASALHGSAGQPLKTPYLGKAEKPSRDELALFEMRGDTYLADRFENLALNAGFVELRNLPAGDYELVLKDEGRRIAVRVIPGEKQNGFVLGRLRQAEVPPIEPVQVESVKTDDKKLVIQLRQASKLSRVHLFVTRFAPAFDAYDRLGRVRAGGLSVYTPGSAESQYVVGRNIGDEYRYIIDRRYAPKFPGNSLDRPGLLLNPWAVRSTETGVQLATKGDEFFGADRGRESAKMLAEGGGATAGGQGDFANLDFLASASAVLVNLLPDENGQIKVDLEALKGQSFVHVVAVDPIHTTSRTISLPEPTTTLVDLRLADGLDPKTHFTQQKQVTVVRGGETFTLSDIATSRFEAYDTLESVHRVLATLSGDATWSEFRFVLEWPKLKPEEKRAQYSKYASHELNFFLMRRDPEFFQAVVKPYLANKKDMTFLDRWLLGTGLDDQRQPWNHGRLNVVERSLLGRR
ncbi:MAG TPA: hypothetical protein PLV92_01525, partial [Pirellulaceae bacterium]|nr:hypothetical protein [Pirellulaceae bacterium]